MIGVCDGRTCGRRTQREGTTGPPREAEGIATYFDETPCRRRKLRELRSQVCAAAIAASTAEAQPYQRICQDTNGNLKNYQPFGMHQQTDLLDVLMVRSPWNMFVDTAGKDGVY